MEWGFLLGLGMITLVIGLVIHFGRKLSRAVERRAPGIALPLNVTPAGTALYACVVGFWIPCLVARVLDPESSLGHSSAARTA